MKILNISQFKYYLLATKFIHNLKLKVKCKSVYLPKATKINSRKFLKHLKLFRIKSKAQKFYRNL